MPESQNTRRTCVVRRGEAPQVAASLWVILSTRSGKIPPVNDRLADRSAYPPVKRQALNLGFKGDRNYVQGGDIFNAVEREFRERDTNSYVSHISFRHFVRSDCDLVWERPEDAETLVAQGRWSASTGEQPFWVIESTRPVTGRRGFDEDRLLAPAMLSRDEIRLDQRSEYTAIEEVIALTKRLSYAIEPDVSGKWVFGQLNLDRALAGEYSSLTIERANSIPGRFNVNRIIVDDEPVGDIRFIVGEP